MRSLPALAAVLCAGLARGSRYQANLSSTAQVKEKQWLAEWGEEEVRGDARAADLVALGELHTPAPFPLLLLPGDVEEAERHAAGVDGVLGLHPFLGRDTLAGVLELDVIALHLGRWQPGAASPEPGLLQLQGHDDGHFESPLWAGVPDSCREERSPCFGGFRLRQLRVRRPGGEPMDLLDYVGDTSEVWAVVDSGAPHIGLPHADFEGVLRSSPFDRLTQWWAQGSDGPVSVQLELGEHPGSWIDIPWEALFLPQGKEADYRRVNSSGCCPAATTTLGSSRVSLRDCLGLCAAAGESCAEARWRRAGGGVGLGGRGDCAACPGGCPEPCCGGAVCSAPCSETGNRSAALGTDDAWAAFARGPAVQGAPPLRLVPEAFENIASERPIVLGRPLFRAVNVVFDRAGRRVGLAQRRAQRRAPRHEYVSVNVSPRPGGRKWSVDISIGDPIQSEIRMEPDTGRGTVIVVAGRYDGPPLQHNPHIVSFGQAALFMIFACPLCIFAAIRLAGGQPAPQADEAAAGRRCGDSPNPLEVELGNSTAPPPLSADGWRAQTASPRPQGSKVGAKIVSIIQKGPQCVNPVLEHED